jgi:uncharacterized membrane protein YsdA (DUF1294 family)
MTWPVALYCAVVIASVVILNIWDRDRRKAMTTAERKTEDDEIAESQF